MSGNRHLQVPNLNLDGPSDGGSQRGSQYGGSQRGSPAGSVGGRSQQGGSQRGSPAPSVGGRSGGGSQHGGSQRGSPGGQSSASRRGSTSGQPTEQRVSPFGPGLGFDPALDPEVARQQAEDERRKGMRRMDLPPEAYESLKKGQFAKRPTFNDNPKAQICDIRVNQFRMTELPKAKVYQYDVTVNTDKDEGVILKKMWESPPWQAALEATNPGKAGWLYDGRKLAWSLTQLSAPIRKTIDLDEHKQGRDPRTQQTNPRPATKSLRNNTFTIVMRPTSSIDLSQLGLYLMGKGAWNNTVLETMSFLDHLLRASPSKDLLSIGRSFYPRNERATPLSFYIGAYKGIYMSARLNQSVHNGGTGIGVNVDVSNTTFWQGGSMDTVIRFYLTAQSYKFDNRDTRQLCEDLKSVKVLDNRDGGRWVWGQSEAFRWLRKLHRLKFTLSIKGKSPDFKEMTIKRFAWDEKFGKECADANNYRFTIKKTGEVRTIYDHFKRKYNAILEYPGLPIIETTRDGAFPPEVCILAPMQKYNFKLNAKETAAMIKFAVTRPNIRAKHIMDHVNRLAWGRDLYLQAYGIKINPQMTSIKARLLQNPEVQFGNGKINPKTSGRWDLRGRTFVVPNPVPLKSWAVVVNYSCVAKPAVQKFMSMFVDTFKKHGGKVVQAQPFIYGSTPNEPINDAVENCYFAAGKQYGAPPQIIMVVLADRTQHIYERCKKSMECRFGIVSQCMQKDHVLKCNPQYCSNVSMKVMVKLGGQVSRIAHPGNKCPWYPKPTMFIGADISHGAGGQQIYTLHASVAAMVVSMDRDMATFAGTCQTNGYRREIMNEMLIQELLRGPAEAWKKKMNVAPAHIFYFRDGVSEGEYAQVLEKEVPAIRKALMEACDMKGVEPKITTIVANKRHHLRFFPEAKWADKNANPLPGTLIEREITHPFYYDFYLCSHVAIQGTARPVHYTVLQDEVGMPTAALQDMIYQQCYQYQRATTPVSLHPAVYYAHLASDRARAHEDDISFMKDPKVPKKTEFIFAKKVPECPPTAAMKEQDAPDLLPIGSDDGAQVNIQSTRIVPWYI